MLRAFRSYVKNIVAKIILALLIVSFAAWGIGDMIVARPGQETVATVGNITISRLEVEQEMQADIEQLRQRLGEQYRPSLIKMLNIPAQVTGRMVAQELMRQEAAALGLDPSDSMVAKVLRTNTMFFNEDGMFDRPTFQRVLQQNGMTERDYVKLIRNDISNRLIGQTISGAFDVPEMAVKIMAAMDKETRQIDLYAINPPAEKVAEPSEEELAAYYETVSDMYASAEQRTVSFVTIEESDIRSQASVTAEELQAAYDERLSEFNKAETRDLELLLYSDEAKAKKARELLVSGESSKAIASKIPPLNADRTIMQAIGKEQLPDMLQDVAFNLQKGEVSEPVSSGFGFHVVKVTAIIPARTQTLDEVKSSLEAELKATKTSEELSKKTNALEDALASGMSLSEAASEQGLKTTQVGPFTAKGTAPESGRMVVPEFSNFASLAFATELAASSAVTQGKPGVYYLLHVDNVQPSVAPPLESVKAEVIKNWKHTRKQTQTQQHVKEISQKLSGSATRAETLGSDQLKQIASGAISRHDTTLAGQPLPAELVQSVFSMNIGEVSRYAELSNGRFAVALVRSSAMPPLPKTLDSEEVKTQRRSIQSNQQSELMEQYMGHLYQKYDAQIHNEILEKIGVEDSES